MEGLELGSQARIPKPGKNIDPYPGGTSEMQVGKAEQWACDSQELVRTNQDGEPAQVALVA